MEGLSIQRWWNIMKISAVWNIYSLYSLYEIFTRGIKKDRRKIAKEDTLQYPEEFCPGVVPCMRACASVDRLILILSKAIQNEVTCCHGMSCSEHTHCTQRTCLSGHSGVWIATTRASRACFARVFWHKVSIGKVTVNISSLCLYSLYEILYYRL